MNPVSSVQRKRLTRCAITPPPQNNIVYIAIYKYCPEVAFHIKG